MSNNRYVYVPWGEVEAAVWFDYDPADPTTGQGPEISVNEVVVDGELVAYDEQHVIALAMDRYQPPEPPEPNLDGEMEWRHGL